MTGFLTPEPVLYHAHASGFMLFGPAHLACMAASAPIFAYPGEFELEAMAAGANRVLDGEEEILEYTGIPAWNGFAWDTAND